MALYRTLFLSSPVTSTESTMTTSRTTTAGFGLQRPGLYSQSKIAQSAPEHGICRGGIRMSTTIGCPIPGASQPKEPVRLIDANELLKHFNTNDCAYDDGEFQAYKSCMRYVRDLVNTAPTVDEESLRPTAKWIDRGYVCGENEYECSACHQTEWRTSASRMKYCMFCGKKMVNAND